MRCNEDIYIYSRNTNILYLFYSEKNQIAAEIQFHNICFTLIKKLFHTFVKRIMNESNISFKINDWQGFDWLTVLSYIQEMSKVNQTPPYPFQ